MINEAYKDFNKSNKKILNFGSGHGGISVLFRSGNHTVYNYDFGNDGIPGDYAWLDIVGDGQFTPWEGNNAIIITELMMCFRHVPYSWIEYNIPAF